VKFGREIVEAGAEDRNSEKRRKKDGKEGSD